jgi:hypothetical protein
MLALIFSVFYFSRYVDAHLGILKDTQQVVTGSFEKYVNNDGVICKTRQSVSSTSLISNPIGN